MQPPEPMMTVALPSMLRRYCGGQAELQFPVDTVAAALRQLELLHPDLYYCVCDETGTVRQHVHLFVNSTLVRGSAELETQASPGDVLYIMPAVSGG